MNYWKKYWRPRIAGIMLLIDTAIFDIFMGDPKFIKRYIVTANTGWFSMYVFAFYGIFCTLLIFALIVSGVNWRCWFYYAVLLYSNWVDTLFFIMQGYELPHHISWLPFVDNFGEVLLRNIIGLAIIFLAEFFAWRKEKKIIEKRKENITSI